MPSKTMPISVEKAPSPSSTTIAEMKNYPKMISKKEAMMKMVGLLPSAASFAVPMALIKIGAE